MKKKFKPKKEPSLLRKIIDVYWQRGLERKAEKTLAKQSWSLEFMARVVREASLLADEDIFVTIKNKDGASITVHARNGHIENKDDRSILDRLDDDVAVTDFIRTHSVR